MTYNDIIKKTYTQLWRESELKDKGQFLSLYNITDHRNIKGTNSIYEVIVSWLDGSVTLEPVSMMWCHDPIYLAKYACEHDLIDNTGWKQLPHYVKNTKNMNLLLKASKAKQRSNTVKIKFGMNIPRDHNEVMMFYSNNGNTNWKENELLEINQIYNFEPFDYLSPATSNCIPHGHTKI